MKKITHPLERLKRIADPVIRQQAVENFSQEFYDKCKFFVDEGRMVDAIHYSFDWDKSPQGDEYWNNIYELIIKDQLELLPELIDYNP